jgi:segregation and condensation protein A
VTRRDAQWGRPDGRIAAIAGDEYEPELEVDLFSLIAAFRAVVERAKQRPTVPIPGDRISIEDRMDQLLARLSETVACGFEDLFDDAGSKAHLIVTFLALLELIRLKRIRVFQAGSFGPIRVYKKPAPDVAAPFVDSPSGRVTTASAASGSRP